MAYRLWIAASALAMSFPAAGNAQVQATRAEILFYTADWGGERLADGRPKVPDSIVERLRHLNIEQVWEILRQAGYENQFDSGFEMVHPDRPFVGRALTVQYMPSRPDMHTAIAAQGEKEGRVGNPNSWPIELLKKGDVYVADGYGKVVDGTLIGDNLGNSIYAKTGTGVVFDAGARDVDGLSQIDGFNAYTRGFDPSFIKDMDMVRINGPVRIGRATVLPGDLVLAGREGVLFIPATIAERVVQTAEYLSLRDAFSHEMLRAGRFSAGQIDRLWSPEINAAFRQWVDAHPGQLKMSRVEFDRLMAEVDVEH